MARSAQPERQGQLSGTAGRMTATVLDAFNCHGKSGYPSHPVSGSIVPRESFGVSVTFNESPSMNASCNASSAPLSPGHSCLLFLFLR
jgi:hypothetical protein